MKKYEILSDEQLIRRLREGDDDIVNYIMDKYKEMVKKKAKTMFLLGGENDDLIQEGMIGLFKAVQNYNVDGEVSFGSFADLCISRQIYTAIKTSQRKKHSPLNSYVSIYGEDDELKNLDIINALGDEQGNPESLFIGKEYAEQLEERLKSKLSKLETKVLYLHLRGVDYKTIAELINKSPKTVDNALQRIKGKASEIIKDI